MARATKQKIVKQKTQPVDNAPVYTSGDFSSAEMIALHFACDHGYIKCSDGESWYLDWDVWPIATIERLFDSGLIEKDGSLWRPTKAGAILNNVIQKGN